MGIVKRCRDGVTKWPKISCYVALILRIATAKPNTSVTIADARCVMAHIVGSGLWMLLLSVGLLPAIVLSVITFSGVLKYLETELIGLDGDPSQRRYKVKGQTVATKHTLHITLQNNETIRVGTNHLQLVVHNNSSVMNYEQVVIRLSAPLGVALKPAKVEIAPLPASSRNVSAVMLITKRLGRHPIKIQANTFPKPREEEFPYMIQQVEVFPALNNASNSAINSILGELTYFQLNHNPSSPASNRSDNGNDIYSKYLQGLARLKHRIESGCSQHSDFLAYEHQLKEFIFLARRHGDTESLRAERSKVIEQLNRLTLSVVNITFNELCDLDT
jgi:hypothetical protein